MHHLHADLAAFRIVLKSEEGFDVHDTREFDLALDSKFAIGRASKNTSKGYLLPAKHNVYIDSPVVSREHAIFTASTTSGAPQVFVTDTTSMHGTYVNGTPLVPNTPKQLSNGDKLQFGVNVNRNDSKTPLHCLLRKLPLTFPGYFVAFKYTFNAEFVKPEYSRGFAVPEDESEEEELEFIQSGRGSQLDPLVLDDSDVDSEHEDSAEHTEHSEDNGDVTMALFEETEELVEAEDSSAEEAIVDNLADDIAESDIESDSASVGDIDSDGPSSPAAEETEYVEEAEQVVETAFSESPSEQAKATPTDQAPSSTAPSAPLEPERVPVDPFFFDFGSSTIPDLPLPPLPPRNQLLDRDLFDATLAPPLPPRPSQKRQRIWDEVSVEPEQQDWFSKGPSTAASHSVPYAGFSYPALDVEHLFEAATEYSAPTVPAADRIQTPPPTLAADFTSYPASPPTHRTGVSITEIVNEQPPTPTSVNSRKRSADDAFEEEADDIAVPEVTEQAAERVTPPAQPVSAAKAVQEVVVSTVEQTTPQPQRPIAQPRSILRKALRAAALMVPATALGATLSIAALTALPESFFTVA